jgi:lipopolysaccharide/colanic/teichoic acid biosynthesis glycosyltransferase
MKGHFLKRPLDIAVSAVGLVVLSPVLAAISIGVRLDSEGPVLFKQERIGYDQKPFEILKFRTMVNRPLASIDQSTEPVVSEGRDRRITRFGRVLRSTSLDELPQLVNILRGDMSLVGPRPIIPEQLTAMPNERKVRFRVRPGLTGLAQVKGRRSLDWLEQLAFDAQYVESVGLPLDLHILKETVKTVFSRSGVYGDSGSNWRAYVDRSDTELSASPQRRSIGGP